MTGPNKPGFRLDEEQRAQVKDCLRREDHKIEPAVFGRFVRAIEASIYHYRATPREGTFREAHDALRALATLAHEDKLPIDQLNDQLKARLAKLPPAAREYIGRRAPTVVRRLGIDLGSAAGELPERAFRRFLYWTKTPEATRRPAAPPPVPEAATDALAAVGGSVPAPPPPLVAALRVLSSEGAGIVRGESRGGGKRSRPRLEPVIMGAMRGAATRKHLSGRPRNAAREELVMHLAMDWALAAGAAPRSGRSDYTGFGSLVHAVFQWVLPEEEDPTEAAAYALRKYWSSLKRRQKRARPQER